MAKTEYNNSITIAKAIGIILMVVGHAGCPPFIFKFIYLFHMPLFFFCSGLFFKPINNWHETLLYVKKKIKALYIPFLKWSFLYLILHNLFMHFGIYNQHFGYEGGSSYYSFNDMTSKMVSIIFTMHDYEYVLGGFWFIRSLFLSTLFISAISLLTKGSHYKKYLFICTFFILLTILIRRFCPQTVLWHDISLGTYGAFFYLVGFIYSKKILNNRIIGHSNLITNGCCIVLLFLLFLYFKTDVAMTCGYNKVLPYTIAAISGTFFILYFSHFLENKNIHFKRALYYTGNHTYEILALHIMSFKVVSFIIVKIYHMNITHIAEHSVIANIPGIFPWWFIYSIFGVSVPLLLCMVYNSIDKRVHIIMR